jgi:hypothetical protein
MEKRRQRHIEFWEGRGPCLILIPPREVPLYDLEDYPRRFADPRAMWESEMERARPVVDWPTDGIPTVRPNLGVILVPALAGQPFRVEPDAMPWPGEPLAERAIRAAVPTDPAGCEVLRKAVEFYGIHRAEGGGSIAAYLADTQGVFDIAHLLAGDDVFLDLADPDRESWVRDLLEISLELYLAASRFLKDALAEPAGTMVHGHGTPQGVFFPHAGARVSEDTATLLSPNMIERLILPSIERCAEPFGGLFVHYCGRHDTLFRQLAQMPAVRAIDLGNPEMHDLEALLTCCAETKTVLYSRVAPRPAENWRAYLQRIGRLVRETGARMVLRPMAVPESREECEEMLNLWHEETIR